MPLEGVYEPGSLAFAADQVAVYENSGGTKGVTQNGLPVIVLTTVGKKSGKLRKSPLMKVERDGVYAAVASLGGAPKNPLWYHNALADPRVELRDGTEVRDMVAREVTGEERQRWWDLAVEAFPQYAEYQRKTDRTIPVLVLEDAPAPH
ncbi:nitroreductase family deazaflavin-dependent oxidoreductase [Prauserella cavernicola]|uniref:Nitroreductase family deazaflavin-dependent oxidoreductase n=1 Tax=Prauserella cavernicola TaxID=2800127 RepID=A0A934V8G1_9PSEU|nr:nitroreductase family deazaflavin-dependent oxidoreductase [Prauserella cavernicola]MBK1787723.1 nitroreductase family deazaflavin-dependent oxidoreductase [Prauserella cavernicola]